jgi:hypothetical protein
MSAYALIPLICGLLYGKYQRTARIGWKIKIK